jgi:hypothetical protein
MVNCLLYSELVSFRHPAEEKMPSVRDHGHSPEIRDADRDRFNSGAIWWCSALQTLLILTGKVVIVFGTMRNNVVKPSPEPVKPHLSALFDIAGRSKHVLSYDDLEAIEIQATYPRPRQLEATIRKEKMMLAI